MKPAEELIVAAARLAASAHQWEQFLEAFRKYRNAEFLLMTQASPDRVQVFQGRAQHASELLTLFTDCREKAQAIEERKDGRGKSGKPA